MTSLKKLTFFKGAFIAVKPSEKFQNRASPNLAEIVLKNIAQLEALMPKKKITGIYRAIRHNGELSCACGASDFL